MVPIVIGIIGSRNTGKSSFTVACINALSLLGKKVAIIGGGPLGCDIALYLAQKDAIDPEIASFLLRYHVDVPREISKEVIRKEREITILEMEKQVREETKDPSENV